MFPAKFLFCPAAFVIGLVGAEDDDDGRIVNGQVIPIQSAPYMVQLRMYDQLMCGGSLIAPDIVITAAHCVHKLDTTQMTVVAEASTATEIGVQRSIRDCRIHPAYSPTTMHSDVALLLLNQAIANAKTLDLCTQPLTVGASVRVSGWGRLGENKPTSNVLRTVKLPIRSLEDCAGEYRRFMGNNIFCASGYEDVGSCRGDSGGPAVSNGEVCGLVAFSYECGKAGHMDAYTSVLKVKDFVQNAVRQLKAL